MTTRTKELDNVQTYNGSLLGIQNNLILSDFSDTSGGTLTVEDTDNGRDWDVGETGTWNGAEATYIGSGTITSGVSLNLSVFGLDLDVGTSVEFEAWDVDGTTYIHYPNGDQASLLDGLVSQLEAGIPRLATVLRVLRVTSLTEYVEKNALLTVDFDAGGSFNLPVCFTRGTLIDTIAGKRPVETLRVGDLVQTADDGLQPIAWIGHRKVNARGTFAPIRIEEGALGNSRILEVSQQHRMLISGWQAELLFGEPEILVAATHLQNDCSIRIRQGGSVEYFHILFGCHQIVFAEDCPSESFFVGETGLDTLDTLQRDEVLSLFPELPLGEVPALARQSLKAYQGRVLAQELA
ncbi:Hint domain-containing protein [Thioclava sp. GXIMD2076]|uniref:Hint domain-containing protein n=1 Tax=Thioclava sp. GXIMD2076 TaxID=3131931 RepID=UPI0030CB22B0